MTYTLSTSSGLPSFFLSVNLSSKYGMILNICQTMSAHCHLALALIMHVQWSAAAYVRVQSAMWACDKIS